MGMHSRVEEVDEPPLILDGQDVFEAKAAARLEVLCDGVLQGKRQGVLSARLSSSLLQNLCNFKSHFAGLWVKSCIILHVHYNRQQWRRFIIAPPHDPNLTF